MSISKAQNHSSLCYDLFFMDFLHESISLKFFIRYLG